MHCTEKFIKHSERVGARFAEQNAGASECLLTTYGKLSSFRSLEAMVAGQNQS